MTLRRTRHLFTSGIVGALAATLLLPATSAAAAVSGPARGKTIVAAGVQRWSEQWTGAAGPERAIVTTVNLRAAAVRTVSGLDRLGAAESLTRMASRTHAIGGINGDFFNGNRDPFGGVVTRGNILKSPKHGWPAQLAIRADGTAAIGPVEFNATLTNPRLRNTFALRSINTSTDAQAGAVTEMTPQARRVLHAGVCVYAIGRATPHTLTLTSVGKRTSSPHLSGLSRALMSCTGAGAHFLATMRKGDKIKISGGIAGSPVQSLISGGRVLVENGKAFHDRFGMPIGGRNPETAVCVSSDRRHLLLAVIDGRNSGPTPSVGVTMSELQAFLLAHGCYTGLMLDGGGSTTTVAAGHPYKVLNHPSDSGLARRIANGLLVYRK